ncbi:hypothetical protein [Shewanella nanhaiensis]|uniref:DUF4760 domain-containing protein n=1 Tax=Shewanella nanhaiensis TaxID=2864872 RepID=A0ABS7DZX6_9GAMM|nr:hypothetical protein [Shewanella nanhaiensis]MBW8182912.1 hypothetical protein [Shewanella nanhaiensis]
MDIDNLLTNEKLIITLISAIVALMFGQLVLYWKYRHNKCCFKRALLEELVDIDTSLDSAIAICRQKLTMNVHKLHSGSMPLPVGSYIFDNYYKEVASDLSSSQRRSYQLIHHYIKDINASIEYLTLKNIEASEAHFLSPNSVDEKHRRLWFDRLASFYEILCITRWHIAHHLENKRNPDLPYTGETYEKYMAFQNEIRLSIKDLVDEAHKMPTEQVMTKKAFL